MTGSGRRLHRHAEARDDVGGMAVCDAAATLRTGLYSVAV